MGSLIGSDYGCVIGPDRITGLTGAAGATVFAMAALNTIWGARFKAQSTKDIASVRVFWNTTTAAGVVQVRIETIDATTGKPTGTLYDPNAAISIVPAPGSKIYTFATLPTAGMVVGNEYAVVLVTTTGGTTMTLSSHVVVSVPGRYSVSVFQAGFEVVGVPICSMVDEDGNEMAVGFCPYCTSASTNLFANGVSGNNIIDSCKITLKIPVKVAGVELQEIAKVGVPAGDLRCRIFNSAGAVVAGTTVTLDKDSLISNVSGKGCWFIFTAPILLLPGTYRLAIDALNCVDASNCWRSIAAVSLNTAAIPTSFMQSTSTNDGATWTDVPGTVTAIGLLVDSFPLPTQFNAVNGCSFIQGVCI